MTRSKVASLLVAICLASVAGPARATHEWHSECYVLNAYTASNCPNSTYHVRWSSGGWNTVSVGGPNPSTCNNATLATIVDNALALWNSHIAATQRPVFYVQEESGLPSSQITVWWYSDTNFASKHSSDPNYSPTSLAITTYRYASNGALSTPYVDLHMNPDAWTWQGCPSSGCVTVSPSVPFDVDVKAIITHETGHLMGLLDIYFGDGNVSVCCSNQTMWWEYNGDGCTSPDGNNTVNDRSLGTGDIAGIADLYSSSTPAHCIANNDISVVRTSALFESVGASVDSAYAVTVDEVGSVSIVLQYFGPGIPDFGDIDTVAVLQPRGREGALATYVAPTSGRTGTFQWCESDSSGNVSVSGLFTTSNAPIDWSQLASAVTVALDSVVCAVASLTTPAEVEAQVVSSPPSDLWCADIVVYGVRDSLTLPIYNQVAADNPAAKVLKITASTGNPQLCKTAIGNVLGANRTWNLYCSTHACGRLYPTEPGPEVYIVGVEHDSVSGVGTSKLNYESAACGHQCLSDYLMYDFDNDGLPDGPMARVPAKTVAHAQASARNAKQFNSRTHVESAEHIIYLAGDDPSTVSVPGTYMDEVRATFESSGSPTVGNQSRSLLRASAYPNLEDRWHALALQVQAGASELYGFGGDTGPNTWIGRFYRSPPQSQDTSAYHQPKRMLLWLPGCLTTSNYASPPNPQPWGNVTKEWLFADSMSVAAAAVVGHMDAGRSDSHGRMGTTLSYTRANALLAHSGWSVARIAYEAAHRAGLQTQLMKDHAASLSVWGSYVRIRNVPPAPVVDLALEAGRTSGALSWTDPTQEGDPAQRYDVRYSINSAITEANFATKSALAVVERPGEGGTLHCADLNLLQCKNYYIAMKVGRNGVWSPMSNVALATTTCSGYEDVFCALSGLMGGLVGEGDELSQQKVSQMKSMTASGPANGFANESRNSVLWQATSGNVTDICPLDLTANSGGSAQYYVATLDQSGTKRAKIDQVGLCVVDHPMGWKSYAGDSLILTGAVVAGTAVFDGRGNRLYGVEGLSDTLSYACERGEILAVEVGAEASGLVLRTRTLGAQLGGDSTGMAIQVRTDHESWRTVGVAHPRRFVSDYACGIEGATDVRLLCGGEYEIVAVRGLAISERRAAASAQLLSAESSRGGDVRTSVIAGDEETIVLEDGDALRVKFAGGDLATGMSRSAFLIVGGALEARTSLARAVFAPSKAGVAEGGWEFALGHARPNPSSRNFTIDFSLAKPTPVSIRVYDVAGRLVRTLVNETRPAGPYTAVWDGKNDDGRRVASSVYFYRMTAGLFVSERKAVLLTR